MFFPFLFIFFVPKFLNGATICHSQIYCEGQLLHVVQMSRIYADSKTFVDMTMNYSPETILDKFLLVMLKSQNKPTKNQISEFVTDNFQGSYNELEPWFPTDFHPNPQILKRLRANKSLKQFTKFLMDIWPALGRKVRSEVFQREDRYSIIPVTNGFIVPGGRFREYYYWDSYWIIKGLLISGMKQTARGMLDNFFQIVRKFGFVPNGGRIYYLDRSQPPLLTMSVEVYVRYTNDYGFVKKNMKELDTELSFWLRHKTVQIYHEGRIFELARYYSMKDTPRPESYYEDFNTGGAFRTDGEKRTFYRNIRTGAETGWDFSARWIFDHAGQPVGKLSNTDPSRILPVDLNAFLCRSFRIVSDLYAGFRRPDKAKFWDDKARAWEEAIRALLYDQVDGVWYDYDLGTKQHRRHFFPSNLTPLWTESYNTSEREKHGLDATNYLKKMNILKYKGGIPTSLFSSGQQWDDPNAWAPLQSIVIMGLELTDEPNAKEMAQIFAKRFIESVGRVSFETKEVFEKYNAEHNGMYGGGGEYVVQTGFGWTNGVLLELIEHYYLKRKIDLNINLH